MGAGEKNLQFQAVQLPAELGQVALQVGLMAELLGFRLPFGEFDHDREVTMAFGAEERLDFFAQAVGLVNQGLGFLAIVPEGRRAIRPSSSPSRFCAPGTSKKPPQMGQFFPGGGQLRFDVFEHTPADDGEPSKIQLINDPHISFSIAGLTGPNKGGTPHA